MRRRLLILLPVVLGLSITLASTALAGHASVRDHVYGKHHVLQAHPRTGLGDNQFIKLTWTGFGPNQVVFFRQCTAHPKNVDRDCTAIYSDPGFTGGDGKGVLYEHVSEGDVRSNSGRTFRCDNTTACSIGVFTAGSLGSGVLQRIAFAPTPDGCPKPVGAAIAGGGADQANHAAFNWGVQLCQPPARLGVNYIPANSQDGLENFVKGLNDFAVTGLPFSDDQKTELAGANRTYQYAPLTASGLVLAYKIFNQDPLHGAPGSQVTDLRLTPQLAAKIFTGQITNWHVDAEINELNPGHVFPPTVRPLVRGDHSAANLEFTSWLTATAGSALPDGWPGPGTDYPLTYLTQDAGIVGGDKLADAIAEPASQGNNNDYFSVGYIGFIDSSEAAYYGLPVARIQNAAGKFVSATPKAVSAALSDATAADSGMLEPNYTSDDPKAYPMPFLSYVTAPTSGISDARGTTLRGFLHYATTTGRSRLPGGYTPLPSTLVSQTAAVVEQVPGHTPVTENNGGGNPGDTTGGTGFPTGGSTGGPPDAGLGPPPDGAAAGSGPGAGPGGGTSGAVAGPPQGLLAEAAGRMVLPSLIALCGVALVAGLALFGAGSEEGLRPRLSSLTGRLPLPGKGGS